MTSNQSVKRDLVLAFFFPIRAHPTTIPPQPLYYYSMISSTDLGPDSVDIQLLQIVLCG
jgi:hypothetical protein